MCTRFPRSDLPLDLKRGMVFYLYAKKYKKRSNGSKDIAIRRIEQSGWSKGEMPISRKPDFSQTCGFRRMIENHNILPFLTKN